MSIAKCISNICKELTRIKTRIAEIETPPQSEGPFALNVRAGNSPSDASGGSATIASNEDLHIWSSGLDVSVDQGSAIVNIEPKDGGSTGAVSVINQIDSCSYEHADGAGGVSTINVTEWGNPIRSEADLSAFLGSGNNVGTLCGVIAITSETTIPAEKFLHIPAESGFDLATGADLILNGSFTSDLKQVFFNAAVGQVYGNFPGDRHPEWWGARRDGTVGGGGTDDTAAINSAIRSGRAVTSNVRSHAGIVKLSPGGYRVGVIDMTSSFVQLRGSGIFSTTLFPDTNLIPNGGECIRIGNAREDIPWGDYGPAISDFFLRFANDTPLGYTGIRAVGDVGEPTVIERVQINWFSDFGVQSRGQLCLNLVIRDCNFGSPIDESLSIDIDRADSVRIEGVTVNPNGPVEDCIVIDSCSGFVSLSNIHMEDARNGIHIKRANGTPFQVSIENVKLDGNLGGFADGAVVRIAGATSNPQLSVHVKNIKRRSQAGNIAVYTLFDADAGVTITEPMINEYRRTANGFNVISTDYQF